MNKSIQEEDKSDEQPKIKISILSELYIDLLGSLMPGLFTVILGTVMVLLTLCTVYRLMYNSNISITDKLISIKELLAQIHYEIAIITLVSSYVIGTIFFRQDPKLPDKLSALHVWLTAKPHDRPGLSVQDSSKKIMQKKGCSYIEILWKEQFFGYLLPRIYLHFKNKKKYFDTQFPYSYLRCYLSTRGLTHLVNYVPWCPQKKSTDAYRTKMFINILKIRLTAFGSIFTRDIVRNEAHVRLATSVWYASMTLFRLGLTCMLLIISLLLIKHDHDQLKYYFSPIVFVFFIIVLCIIMKHHLQKCIHYMRVREVVYVLESAHLASKASVDFNIKELVEKEIPPECQKCAHLKTKESIRDV
jgi:hypothetical protein